MTANNIKSCLGYLKINTVNSYHRASGKKPNHTDYSALSKEFESGHKAPKFKAGDRVRITKFNNIFSKDYTEKKGWKKCLWLMLCWKTILGRIKLEI